jgi:hypothetical protein
MKKIWQVIFGLIFTVSFCVMLNLESFYTWERPLSPQPELGRVFPILVNHNKTVYVTAEDKQWFELTYLGMAIGGIACI